MSSEVIRSIAENFHDVIFAILWVGNLSKIPNNAKSMCQQLLRLLFTHFSVKSVKYNMAEHVWEGTEFYDVSVSWLFRNVTYCTWS